MPDTIITGAIPAEPINTEPQETALSAAQTTEPQTAQTDDIKTFTQEDLNRVGAKEKAAGERSVLTALGLTEKSQLAGLAETLTAYKAEQDGKMSVSQRLDAEQTKNAGLQSQLDALRAEHTAMTQELLLRGLEIPPKEIPYYRAKIAEYAAENSLSFEEASTAYMQTDPLTPKPTKQPSVSVPGVTGNTPMITGVTAEQYGKMGYAERLKLKNENPTLYASLSAKK
jgi:hypothetical protein